MPAQPNNMPALWQSDGTTSNWDGLRRDQDLWLSDGDCAIYLYAQGQSRRGPSFQIPFQTLLDAQCDPLLDQSADNSETSYTGPLHSRSNSDETNSSSDTDNSGDEVHRIYLGAPQHLSKDEALTWRITTRNFIAWLLGKPLVGSYLSQALTDLLGRMAVYRAPTADNIASLLDYADAFGYTDFANKPELALAMLGFADQCKLEDVWIDAFVHCVGMNERLSETREYDAVRTVNKVLIKRSALQMDLQSEKDSKAIDTFLAGELSQSRFIFSAGVQRHLDQFRSFLRSHFESVYGSWPTSKDDSSIALSQELLVEFDCLYSYLADLACPRDDTPWATSTDLNIQRIIDAFDQGRSLEPLPFTVPLLPDIRDGAGYRTQAHWALRVGRLGSKDKPSAVDLVGQAYISASNRQDRSVLASPLVQAYERFESDLSKSFDDQLSFADARKVRWVLIYAMLQTLVCTTRAPSEVRDTESASYPLCCSVAGLPTWSSKGPIPVQPTAKLSSLSSIRDALQAEEDEEQDPHEAQTKDFTNIPAEPEPAPLVPRKSIRRSVREPKDLTIESADSYFTSLSSLDELSVSPPPSVKSTPFAINPLMIPARTTSYHGRNRSKTSTSSASSISANSSNSEIPRPSSVGSDTVPSLSWSRYSPTSDSASDALDSTDLSRSASSEEGSDSSSIYSHRSTGGGSNEIAMDAPPSLPQKSAARFGDIYGTAESFDKALWGEDGQFVCPGLAA